MKQKISPGHMLDFISPEELAHAMDNQTDRLLQLLGKNARFVRSIVSGEADANGNFSLEAGPDAGFLWSLRWVSWSGASGNMNMYLNTVSNLNLLGQNYPAGTAAQEYGKEIFIIKSPDVFVFTQGSSTTTANTPVQVQLAVLEVPFSHESQLF